MFKLSPSILSADFANLGYAVRAVQEAGAQYLHLDIMDGHFVPNISMGSHAVKCLRKISGLIFDVHLMIESPERYAQEFIGAGADIVCFHLEAAANPGALIRTIREAGKSPAIAIKPGTPAEDAIPYLDAVDMVLIMSVEPGFGGQKFMPDMLEKARILRGYIKSNGLRCDIEMDGGIKLSTAAAVLKAGVNVIVAGTDIFGAPDIWCRVRSYLTAIKTIDKSTNLQ